MKIKRKLFALVFTIILGLATATPAFASEADTYQLKRQILNYYRYHQAAATTDIARLCDEISQVNPEEGANWQQITDYWIWLDSEMRINYNALPDGLPEDDSLCIVVLGYALKSNGAMQDELIGRLEVALASARKYPNAYILCTGGGTARNNPYATEAGRMARWLAEQGISENRIIVENQSQTTTQNAQFSCEILSREYPQVQHLAMVTSDYHLRRGCLLFWAQSCLANCELDIVSNAGFRAEGSTEESAYLLASDLSMLTGVSMGGMAEPSLTRLTDIIVDCAPTLEIGQHLQLTVTAIYQDGFTRVVTGNSFISGYFPDQPGTQVCTLSYTENGITCSEDITIELLVPETEAQRPSPTEPEISPAPEPLPDSNEEPPHIIYPLTVLALLLIALILLLRLRRAKQ